MIINQNNRIFALFFFLFSNNNQIMSSTPSSYYNSKIHGSKIELSSEDKSSILTALSFIWMKTKKKVEFCHFQEGRARISYKKNEGRLYFDLQESLSEHVI